MENINLENKTFCSCSSLHNQLRKYEYRQKNWLMQQMHNCY